MMNTSFEFNSNPYGIRNGGCEGPPGLCYIQAMPGVEKLNIRSTAREEMIDITREVEKALPSTGDGICVLFVQHTTCGLTVNENADPDVQSDMLGFLQRLIPRHEPNFKHFEHNSDAHIKSSLVGSSITVPFESGKLLLGRWQGVYLCEFDGPRARQILMMVR